MTTYEDNDRIGPSKFYRTVWTTTPVNCDILAIGSGQTGLANAGRACRKISVGTPGTLVVVGLDGQEVTIPASVITVEPVQVIQAVYLKSTSTAKDVVVYW